MPKNNLSLVRPTAEDPTPLTNYTMCPNWIYDQVLVAESASVAKVVLYVNRNTTGRSQAGQRASSVQASYGTIAREMNMSLRAVGEAVRTALAKGYIIQVKAGRAATPNTPGEGGWYSLNWQWGDGSNTQDINSYVKLEVVADEPKTGHNEQPRSARFAGSVNPNRQNLLDQVMQNLPPCLNKTESESNKRFDLRVGSFHNGEATTAVNSTEETIKPVSIKPKRQGSAIIGRLITDFTREMGDAPDLLLPNISRTLGLWQRSGLNETTFVDRLYAARKRVLSSATPIWYKRQTTDGQPSDYPNRMPYFFRVLENLLEAPADLAQVQEAEDPQPVLASSVMITPPVAVASVLPAEPIVAVEQVDHQEALPPVMPTPAEASWSATPAESKGIVEAVVEKYQAATFSPPLAVITPPVSPKTSVIQTWAERWTLDAAATLDQWQRLCGSLETPLQAILASKVLGITVELAAPTLQTAVGLEAIRSSTSTNIIVLFRNSFEAHYLSRYLPEVTDAFSSQLGWPVKLHSVCME